eukprot:Lithocolla_globosa_v1_NODE_5858_length_1174_cov_9.339589.p1 type:complete len:298 gc:universal NODE_5858_length_1174_cov_9.339589:1109-216(-)
MAERETKRQKTEEGEMLLAIPKKGRLNEKVVKVLEGAGVRWTRQNRLDIAKCTNLPVQLVFLPAADIPKYVADGNVDMGITGQDMVAEADVKVEESMRLDFGHCKLVVQAPVASKITDIKTQLSNSRIVTSFPTLSRQFFEKNGVKNAKIMNVSGSVEVACSLGLADAVVDLVETGTTMRAAGLEAVATVLSTEAVLIANPHMSHPHMAAKLLQRLEGYIAATKLQMINYNVARAKLADAKIVTPGKKSPTISPLEDPDYVAVSALVAKNDSAEIMDKLQAIGATDILLFDMANCRV